MNNRAANHPGRNPAPPDYSKETARQYTANAYAKPPIRPTTHAVIPAAPPSFPPPLHRHSRRPYTVIPAPIPSFPRKRESTPGR